MSYYFVIVMQYLASDPGSIIIGQETFFLNTVIPRDVACVIITARQLFFFVMFECRNNVVTIL